MIFNENDINITIHEILRFTRKSIFYNTEKRDFYVLSCRLRGETVFYYNEKEIPADPRHCLLLPPNIAYAQRSSDEEIICVHFSADCAPLQEPLSLPCNTPGMAQRFLNLHKAWEQKERGYLLQCKSIFYAILHELSAAQGQEKNLLAPAIDYISEHFSEPDFNINTAIDRACISPAYFRRLFRRYYNKTPIQFINELKINYAKSLLESRSYTAAEIAEKAGFTDEKYFYTVFKKTVGTSPAKWQML